MAALTALAIGALGLSAVNAVQGMKKPKAPALPQLPDAPDTTSNVQKAAEDANKLAQRRRSTAAPTHNGTLLTTPRGAPGGAPVAYHTLLGQ